jgi:diguanylate cyclase
MDRTLVTERRVRQARLLPHRPQNLPPPVYREFIDMLFSMRLPVVGLGAVFVLVAGLIAREWDDGAMALLAGAGGIVTILRLVVMTHYHRSARRSEMVSLRRWERVYGAGVGAFALLIGVLNLCAFRHDEPLIQLLSVSLYFAFGAGLVSRISIRPVICASGVVLATVPTIGAILLQQVVSGTARLHAELYGLETLLITMIAALSLQSMAHLYRQAVAHHTSEHDLARLAKSDALTGLANRLMLRERFQTATGDAKSGVHPLAIHFLDLDGFKPVNDLHGHLDGDTVLKWRVASRRRSGPRTPWHASAATSSS